MKAGLLLATVTLLESSSSSDAYRIGTSGIPWGPAEKTEWFQSRTIHRSYRDEVVDRLDSLDRNIFEIEQYGTLEVPIPAQASSETSSGRSYPLFAVKTKDWKSDRNKHKPCVLITGGVHGYEKSGVHGALLFLQSKKAVELYSAVFNILVLPCVSPWGYETVERWNANAVDPNRSFVRGGDAGPTVVEGRSFNPEPATDESKAVIGYLDRLGVQEWLCHFDLHETTDTDRTEFRPAKRARDGEGRPTDEGGIDDDDDDDPIPDGFYLVSDATQPQAAAWHTAMIDAVRAVTHIAPTDSGGRIIGETVVQEGVIAIPPPRTLGLCAGVTDAPYATTTEVYPDSPTATEEQCNRAQVACVEGGLDFLIGEYNLTVCQ
jgi:hypothetical protein